MAFRDTNVEEYVRSLFERQPSATDESVAANASPGVVIEDEGEPVIRPLSQASEGLRQAMATRAPLAATVAPRALPELSAEEPVAPPSYLEALSAAQDRDRMASGFAGGLAGAEQAAQILSRGLYRPMGLAPTPSAVSELEQRQRAVQEMLAAKRGERAESRQAQAFEQEAELNTVQIARQNALMEAEKLRLAMEQGEAPYKVLELQANVRKALAQAQLAEETAKAKGRPVVVMPRPAKEPKAPPAEKPKEPKIIAGIPPDYDINPNKPPNTDQINKFGNIVATKYELQGMTRRMRELASRYSFLERSKPGSAKTAVSQLATQIQIKAKDIAELGALSGPDMGLMKSMASNPSSIETAFTDVMAQLDGLDWWSSNAEDSKAKAWGFSKVGAQAQPGGPSRPAAPQSDEQARQDRQADFARNAVAEFKRAQEAGASPEVLERLRKEAQAAIKAAGGK